MRAARAVGFRLVAALAVALTAATVRAEALTVFAAASTKTAMDEIALAWEAETGEALAVSLAGTSALARQIELGAPADVFLSANPDWMDRLEEAGLIAADTRVDLLGNTLVLVGRDASGPSVEIEPEFDLAGRLQGGRLAMALVDAVPAGLYGKAALESLELWESVAPSVAQTDNVRAALALVASGEAPLGIVYATDAEAEARVSIVGRFPANSHPPIVYPVAAVAASRDPDAAAAFVDFLQGPVARAAFERQGFTVLAP